jgi:hypothetical protein
MMRQDRLNWQIRFAEHAMTPPQLADFPLLFRAKLKRSTRTRSGGTAGQPD